MMVLKLLFLVLLVLVSEASAVREIRDTSSCSSEFVWNRHNQIGTGIQVDLHHSHGPCSPTNLPPRPFSQLLKSDEVRVRALISRLSTRRGIKSSSTEQGGLRRSKSLRTPLGSGDSVDVGNYVVTMGLGTPAKSYHMIVDTGSSFNWLQCQPCSIYCHDQKDPIFDPKASETYKTLPCDSVGCAAVENSTINPSSCTKSNKCIYETDYGDGSYSVGYLSTDTLNFAGTTLDGFVFGCGEDNDGLYGKTAGLIGLSRDKLSLSSQLAPTHGNIFSYCLPTATGAGGYLSVGPYTQTEYKFTPLISNPLDTSLYFLNLTDITVANKSIPVNSTDYATNPVIIDSGTVVSRLPSKVYTELSQEIASALSGHERLKSPVSMFDTCYKGRYETLGLPEVTIVFGGGSGMVLPAENLFYDFEDEGLTCLAFSPNSYITVIGNLQHQTFDVLYDVANSLLGFAPGGCS